jgi:predicted Fe-Mo cluster-binding NifX family protein
MKVAISTDQGYVSAHFGRCASYTIIEINEGKILNREEIPNPGHQPGFLPQFLSEKGVSFIIAGGMGPRAQGLFAEKNIQAIIGVQGPVDEVIQKLLRQELEAGEDLCGHKHQGDQHLPSHSPYPDIHPKRKKICITAQGYDLEAELDPSFGRAHYFLIIDPDTLDYEALQNPYAEASQGAGIQTAQLISNKDVGAVLTGHCGPNAQRVLDSEGIRIITGLKGKIREILSQYKSEEER